MKQIFYIILSILVSFSTFAEGSGRKLCMYLLTDALSIGSNLNARHDEDVVFVHVNGQPVPFKNISSIYDTDNPLRATKSKSEGCFYKTILKEQNDFKLGVAWPADNASFTGDAKAELKLKTGDGNLRQLCQVYWLESDTNRTRNCVGTINLSINEIDPEMAAELERLKRQSEALRKEIDALRGNYAALLKLVNDLKGIFNNLTNKDFDSIAESDFAGFEKELAEAISILRDGQKSSAELTKAAAESIASAQEKAGEIKATVERFLTDGGLSVDVLDFPVPAIDNLEIEFPQAAGGDDDFDSGKNVFDKLATAVIEEVKLNWPDRRLNIFAAINAWSKRIEELRPIVLDRALKSPKEAQAFASSIERVHKFIFSNGCNGQGCLTTDFWFKDSPIPSDVQKTVDHDLDEIDREKARELKASLNSWKDPRVTPEQQKVLDIIRGLGAAARAASSLPAAEAVIVKPKLKSILSQTVDVAKVVGKVAIGFTIAGDAIDLYEVTTGKDFWTGQALQPWEQALSGVGLIFGSGKFWRAMADEASGVRKMQSELSVIESTVAKVERFGPLRKGPLHEIKYPDGSTVADTFRSSSYNAMTLSEPLKVYRVYGGQAGELGSYVSRTKPTGGLQMQLDAALLPAWNNSTAKWVEMTLPKGSTIYEGFASPQYLKSRNSGVATGQLLGGGNQIYINGMIDKNWVTARGDFP